MARTISQIYAEAVHARNNYLQLTELDSGRTRSKVSIMNLLTYVMATMVHLYETMLDVFQVDIVNILSSRITGTASYYVAASKLFQFDPITQTGDKLVFNEDTLRVEYETVDATHRIVTHASYEDYPDGEAIILKICKDNTDSEEVEKGSVFAPLSDAELTAFKNFIGTVKFCGAKIYCVSNPGDILTIVTPEGSSIYFDDSKVSRAQAIQNIKQALIDYVRGFQYDGYVQYQKVIDVIQQADGVADVNAGVEVYISNYDSKTGTYNQPVLVSGRIKASSGHIRLTDVEGNFSVDSLSIEALSEIPTSTTSKTKWVRLPNGVWERVRLDQMSNYTQKWDKSLRESDAIVAKRQSDEDYDIQP